MSTITTNSINSASVRFTRNDYMSNNLLITATMTRYADNYGSFRYMLNNRRISKFAYEGLERQATNPCCFLTTSYRNRKGDLCYRHSYIATFNVDLSEFI